MCLSRKFHQIWIGLATAQCVHREFKPKMTTPANLSLGRKRWRSSACSLYTMFVWNFAVQIQRCYTLYQRSIQHSLGDRHAQGPRQSTQHPRFDLASYWSSLVFLSRVNHHQFTFVNLTSQTSMRHQAFVPHHPCVRRGSMHEAQVGRLLSNTTR